MLGTMTQDEIIAKMRKRRERDFNSQFKAISKGWGRTAEALRNKDFYLAGVMRGVAMADPEFAAYLEKQGWIFPGDKGQW